MNTTYFDNLVMGNVFGSRTVPAPPAVYYVGLSSTEPEKNGTNVTEPASGAYQRVRLDSLSVPVNGKIQNERDIIFPESTEDWGVMTHLVIFDAQSGGNLLIYNPLTKKRTVESDTVIRLEPGAFSITLGCE